MGKLMTKPRGWEKGEEEYRQAWSIFDKFGTTRARNKDGTRMVLDNFAYQNDLDESYERGRKSVFEGFFKFPDGMGRGRLPEEIAAHLLKQYRQSLREKIEGLSRTLHFRDPDGTESKEEVLPTQDVMDILQG